MKLYILDKHRNLSMGEMLLSFTILEYTPGQLYRVTWVAENLTNLYAIQHKKRLRSLVPPGSVLLFNRVNDRRWRLRRHRTLIWGEGLKLFSMNFMLRNRIIWLRYRDWRTCEHMHLQYCCRCRQRLWMTSLVRGWLLVMTERSANYVTLSTSSRTHLRWLRNLKPVIDVKIESFHIWANLLCSSMFFQQVM